MNTSVNTTLYGPLILDIANTVMTHAEATLLLDARIGGVILFARNFETRTQLCALTASIHAVRVGTHLPKLLIAVDHEGGRVQRFKTDGFTHLPTMASLGRLWQNDTLAGQRLASQVGFVLAAELLSCGIDLSFTPVLDLDYGQSCVIGDRAFAANPEHTSDLARALISGLHRAGMRSCGKHFPGHGFVAADSHHEIPVDERDLETIMTVDAKPYTHLQDVLDSVMPAHVIYPKVDSQPAGFSKVWLTILRDPQQLAFEGVIFSDDLSMAGATIAGDIHARAKAALSAGCDMVLVCNAPEMALELLNGDALHQTPSQAYTSHIRIKRLVPNTLQDLGSWDTLQAYAPYQLALNAVKVFLKSQF